MSALAKWFPDKVKKEFDPDLLATQDAIPVNSDSDAKSDINTSDNDYNMHLEDNTHTAALGTNDTGDLESGEEMDMPGSPINDAIGEHTYDSGSERPNGSVSSSGSWYDVPTPLPSPPRSPPHDRDDAEPSDDEEGFRHMAAEDYRDYERWYAEDDSVEDTEMLAESLTDGEVDSLIMLAIQQFGSVTQSDYKRIRYLYRDKLHLLTLQRLRTRIATLSGVSPVPIHCCVTVRHAFTGKYAEETTCSSCGEPHYDYKGRPRQVFQYLPATPRPQAYFNNPDVIRKMLYRDQFVHVEGQMNNIFNSELYLDMLEQNIIIDGVDTGIQYFRGKHNLATAIMTDGVDIFEQAHEETCTCWPIMAQNLNLPPAERAQLRNLILLGMIPGPRKPKDFDSCIILCVEECIKLA